jgi:eukaryotic-like serine/threonine-protein kinase
MRSQSEISCLSAGRRTISKETIRLPIGSSDLWCITRSSCVRHNAYSAHIQRYRRYRGLRGNSPKDHAKITPAIPVSSEESVSEADKQPENPNPAKIGTQAAFQMPDLDATVTMNAAGAPLGIAEAAAGSKCIGHYQLVAKLGQGGMGQVWLAEQTAPVRRKVALKLIKAGVYDSTMLLRFQSERQSLAMMDHPAIAKVFDAGATPEGEPYFVMEYVPGVPITDYCDRKHMPIQERLELFIKLCEGVQHAHQKAIIHRDLKPANILVVELDGKPVPRIIDFGLAKAATPRATDQALFTQLGFFVGTPGYMSPEQADPGVQDVDTRTDVYSLGVILYVLLTGSEPFDMREWHNKPLFEVLRQLREEDPPVPSAQIKSNAPLSALSAVRRGVPVKQFAKVLRGDLDWIAMKAIEKDRARRYGTPSELAADVRRYLNHEPVVARPASAGYRVKKYIRRHRFGVAAAAVILVVLTASAILEGVQLQQTRRERDRAARITDFMTGMFQVVNPSEARGNTITAREVLDKASEQIGGALSNDPGLQAQLMHTMARTYAGLGLYGRAQALTERALATQRSLLGERSRETLETQSDLAQLIRSRSHLSEAEKLLVPTLDLQRKILGPADPDTLLTMDRLGYVYANEARYSEAEGLFRQTLAVERRVLGPDNSQTLNTLNELAEILTPQGRYAEADKIYSELIAAQRRTLGPDHPATLLSMSHAAENLSEEGRYADAEKMFTDVIAGQRRVLGPEHPQTLRAMTILGVTLMREGRYAEADKLQSQVIEVKRRVLGPAHTSTLQSMEMEAMCLSGEGRYSDADKMFLDVIQTAEKNNLRGTVAEAWYNFATAEAARGRVDEAFADLNRAVADGLVSAGEISADPELKSLRGDPRFESVVAKARETSAGKPR